MCFMNVLRALFMRSLCTMSPCKEKSCSTALAYGAFAKPTGNTALSRGFLWAVKCLVHTLKYADKHTDVVYLRNPIRTNWNVYMRTFAWSSWSLDCFFLSTPEVNVYCSNLLWFLTQILAYTHIITQIIVAFCFSYLKSIKPCNMLLKQWFH